MYNEQIEELINAALADGVLTEKEKQILFKKAQGIGIDLDEFEMVLDARLVELKKKEKEKTEKSAPKSTKYGDVRKCPVCGALVPALAGTCPECGYEFSGMDANLSSKKLSEKIEKINANFEIKIEKEKYEDDKRDARIERSNSIASVIKTFPLPTTKADLFEFIIMTESAFMDVSNDRIISDAYFAKYKECILKVKSIFSNDEKFAKFLNEQLEMEESYKKNRRKHKGKGIKPSTEAMIIAVIVIVICFGIIALLVS